MSSGIAACLPLSPRNFSACACSVCHPPLPCSYFIYSCGTCTTYSNIRCFRDDLLKHPPDYFV